MMQHEFMTNAVRNEHGIFINSQVFREEGLRFMKTGSYCLDRPGTHYYKQYWDEQLRRCREGYSVSGVKITQHHYFYLNFTQIKLVEKTGGTTGKKKIKNPDFWDGDYNFFWGIEIAKNGLFTSNALAPSTPEEKIEYYADDTTEERRIELETIVLNRLQLQFKIERDWLDGGHHILVGKSRRKGYSYKNAAICSNTYNTERNSLSIIGAFDKKFLYPRGTMGMVSEQLDFLNKQTAWTKARDYVNRPEHKKASFIKMVNGAKVEAGYMSEVMAISFKDNPDAARGKDAILVLLEETGAFPNLKESFNATAPGLSAGKFITGQIIGFGTGGDMEYGTTDFADMFYHPKQFNMLPFINIWDHEAENSTCGFFHPVTWNMEGYYDEQGNSDIAGATKAEEETRKRIIKESTSSLAIQSRAQEFPFNPSEAFLTVSMNDFPVVELRNQYNKVMRNNLHLLRGVPCHIFYEDNKVKIRPDLEGVLQPIWDYNPKIKDLSGAVVIYEQPISNPPKGFYKIGFDPYRQAQSADSKSLASITVYKSSHVFSYTREMIVAEYIGRPYSPSQVNRIAEMLAEVYNTEVMHENEVTHVKDHFERRKKLHLLAAQPDTVISKSIGKSKVARTYGIHMVEKLKDAGEKYIKEWLLTERDIDEDGNKICNLDLIFNPGLLEELIFYNRKGNFDRVMSLMMVMFQVAEEDENKVHGSKDEDANAKALLALMQKQFRKRA